MQAHAIKYKDGWFIRDLPELDTVESHVISLTVDLSEEQCHEMGYKELQGVALMERYAEKRSREVPFNHEITDIQRQLRKTFDICASSLNEWLREK